MRLRASAKRSGYWVYRHVVPWPFLRLRDARIYSDVSDPALAEMFTGIVAGTKPVFIGRIGGSDYEVVNRYYNDASAYVDHEKYSAAVRRVQELNGYFDLDHDYANFIRYLDDMVTSYERADCLLYCNEGLITKFQHNVFQKKDMKLLNDISRGKALINYTFVEAVSPFLSSFKSWGEGKRILIVSPFSRSIEFQNARRDELIVDYEFPDFDLVTYTSPVTYSAEDDTKETLGVSTSNWHEECRRMADEISELDFDIAFLSCASYAMHLGNFIRDEMGHTAIYTGGILNVLFNIYGKRYDTPFFNGLTRRDTQIDAFENDDVAALSGGRTFENEALGAYFGKRSP